MEAGTGSEEDVSGDSSGDSPSQAIYEDVRSVQRRASLLPLYLAALSAQPDKFMSWSTTHIDAFNAIFASSSSSDPGEKSETPLSRASPLCDISTFLHRIDRAIDKEQQFLARLLESSPGSIASRLHSSNIIHVEAVTLALSHPNVTQVCGCNVPFPCARGKGSKKATVDIVCDAGSTWIWVVARNAASVTWESEEGREAQRRGLRDKLRDLMAAAEVASNVNVVLALARAPLPSIDESLREELGAVQMWEGVPWDFPEVEMEPTDGESAGCSSAPSEEEGELRGDAHVLHRPEADEMVFYSVTPHLLDQTHDRERINLDATALLALITDVAHGLAPQLAEISVEEMGRMTGNAHSGNFMKKQAEDELQNPVLMQIEPFIAGKQLVATPIAMYHVIKILNTMGSEEERKRSEELFQRITIVGPVDSVAMKNVVQRPGEEYDLRPEEEVPVSARIAALEHSRIVHERNKEVFGVADSLHITTLTSNQRFIQTAAQAGVYVRAVLHAPRALVTYELSQELQDRSASRWNCSLM